MCSTIRCHLGATLVRITKPTRVPARDLLHPQALLPRCTWFGVSSVTPAAGPPHHPGHPSVEAQSHRVLGLMCPWCMESTQRAGSQHRNCIRWPVIPYLLEQPCGVGDAEQQRCMHTHNPDALESLLDPSVATQRPCGRLQRTACFNNPRHRTPLCKAARSPAMLGRAGCATMPTPASGDL